MNEILGWIITLGIIIITYRAVSPKKEKKEEHKTIPEYLAAYKKIFKKHILPMLIALPISYLIVIIIGLFFSNAYDQRPFDPDNFLSVIYSELNNIIAIIIGIAFFLDRYIAVLLKTEKIKDVRFWYTLLDASGAYVLIVFITIVPEFRDFMNKIFSSIFGIN